MALIPKKGPGDPRAMYLEWAQAIIDHGTNLTTWEEEFAEDIQMRLTKGYKLSERQAEILEQIYAEKTP